jgi:4-amino-4-deoxy-L-arabinose transferase-like glycosyltransferase
LQPSTLAKRAWPLFFLAAIAFYLYGLGALPLMGPDEPRYAQVAREMLMRGDAVTPTLGGHTWFEKPALLYWMLMASFASFGVTEWAARLGPACAGLLSILAVYWLGLRTERASFAERSAGEVGAPAANEGERAALSGSLGLWSAIALASSAGLIVFSRAVSFDVVVTCTMTGALALFFVSELETVAKRRGWLLAAFYACVGASLLAKGLIGIVIPFGIIGAYFLLQRRWPDTRALKSLAWGLPLALAVAAAWYVPVISRNGWKFVDEFFIQHHFARYVSNKYRHPGPIFYYLPVVLTMAVPWPVLLLSALARTRHWQWDAHDALGRLRLFALAWLCVPTIFFSVSGSKLPGYILPAMPAVALLVGERLSRLARGEDGTLVIRATGALLLALAAGGIVYAARSGQISVACAALVAAPLFIAGLLSLWLPERRGLCLMTTAGAMFLSITLAAGCAAGAAARSVSTRDLLREADARGLAQAPVCGLYVIERTSEFYASERVMRDERGEVKRFEGAAEILAAARRSGSTILVFVPLDGLAQLTDYKLIHTDVIGDNGTVALVAVQER